MKKKLLCCALLAGFGMAQSAMAQSYDDRWYIGAGVGVVALDPDRAAADNVYGTLGFGKFISRNISLDVELWHSDPDLNFGPTYAPANSKNARNWEMMSLTLDGRYHFVKEGRDWAPFIVAGIGVQEHHDGTQRQPIILGYNKSRTGTDMLFKLGFGATKDIGYAYLRGELGVRVDFDDEGFQDNDEHFVDAYAGLTFLFPLGPEAAPPPEPVVVVQKTCADLDDDGDGVNNCDDKCPGSQAGQAIGPDGCPVPEPEPVMEPKPFRG